MSEVTWQEGPEFIGANRAEHAMVGDYELLVGRLRSLPTESRGRAILAARARRAKPQ
jgi:hypothetical protein